MDLAPRIYAKSAIGADCFLAQGEIVSNLVQIEIDLPSLDLGKVGGNPVTHPLAIVLTQGCDLEQDYHASQDGGNVNNKIPAVLFCDAIEASVLSARVHNERIWSQIKSNSHERYHFFQAVEQGFDACGQGLPEMGVDFKRYFTVPTTEVYYRIRRGEALRRCCLESPYLEHFCRRFANFLSRIALPIGHVSI